MERAFLVLLVVVSAASGSLLAAAHEREHSHSCSHGGHHHSRDHAHSHSSHDHHHDDHSLLPEELAEEEDLKRFGFGSSEFEDSRSELSKFELWAYAMGSSLLVSLVSLICLATVPLISSKGPPPANFVNTLAAFGGGAMMGDAFLHQLPHAFGDSSHSTHSHSHSHHSHDHDNGGHAHSLKEISTGLCVLAGILLFFMVEKIVRYVEEHGFQTSHSHHHHPKKNDGKAPDSDKSSETEKIPPKNSKKKKAQKNADGSKLVLGYLNLFSDGVHNFTDGMAIGAAFLLYGTKGGWSRTFFLLVHELPQEVGDFGILVRSGFTVFKALAFNFLSALVALAGTAVALVFGANPEQSSVIEAFTAGGFLYISLAGVIPEMHQQGSSIKSTLLQLFALTCGIGTAVAISIAE
ncbi:hypothetical protein SELMODRAFT_418658 [Selaginella moellendorffii]|uniref:ZIP family transporter n=1 Tax=Selaginella moellendorffii TaxID=88036 RepID=D8S6R2_SELML|nr:IAA-alanine resistance protein 1 [Selaginella moellendorffii]EFJ19982.1 hypothetical protein SELMODRAFT_418658 [Selaginella moellendorffii]|eukprot:XP_002979025.1 IAA-alanine resistance protein 1 [Selaginella moellendorffii]